MYPKKFKDQQGATADAQDEVQEKFLLIKGYVEVGSAATPVIHGNAAAVAASKSAAKRALLGEIVIYNHPGDQGSLSGFYCAAQVVDVNLDGSVSLRTAPPRGTPELLKNIKSGLSGDVGTYQYPEDYQTAADAAAEAVKKAKVADVIAQREADKQRRADLEAAKKAELVSR